jgi:hypothetical protein
MAGDHRDRGIFGRDSLSLAVALRIPSHTLCRYTLAPILSSKGGAIVADKSLEDEHGKFRNVA